MGRNINSSNLTKDYILKNVAQETIFSTYLNIPKDLIINCINTGELICSPLRYDKHPTCGFRYDNKGRLKLKDFAGYFWGDCFDLVAYIMSNIYNTDIRVNNKKDFISVLRHITLTFKNIFYGEERDELLDTKIVEALNTIRKKKSIIEVVIREWNKLDEDYWKQFGISLKYLNINFVFPVEQYYIDRNYNPEPKYFYNATDPCYAYSLGQDKTGVNNIKLYFPNRTKDSHARFITNCNHLEGIYNLNKDDYDYIILTKSSKDRLSIGSSLYAMCSLYGGLDINIGVINIPHETYKLRLFEYDWLKSKLKDNGMILSLMDNDRTGILEAKSLFEVYNINPLLIPKNSGCKDYSEYYQKYGLKHIYNDIKNLIQNYIPYANKTKIIANRSNESNSLPY